MAKVVCKKCSNEKIVVVNEMIEQPKKEGYWFFALITTIAIIAIIIGFSFLTQPPVSRGVIGLTIMGYSLLIIVVTWFFRLLQPFRYKNKTKCICLECGHTWYLGEDDNKSQEV